MLIFPRAGVVGVHGGLMDDAYDLKDRTLFWIYFIEWLTILGTTMASSTLLYMLMVRRRLYRTVDLTRLVSK